MAIHLDGLDVEGLANLVDILEASPDCVKILDPAGRIYAINSAGSAFLAQPADRLEGRLWASFLPQPVQAAARAAVEGALAGRTLRLSTPCETLRGSRYCDLTVSPMRSTLGRVSAVLAITRDVTDLVVGRLEAERTARALARQAAALRAAGLVAKLGAWEIDYGRGEIFWSEEIWTLMGLAPRPLTLHDAPEVFAGDNRDRLRAAFHACKETGASFALDLEVDAPSGALWVRVFGERDVDGVILRGAVQDITAQRAAEQELTAARDAAQAASAAQSAFLANVSHEIRTPLHGILGMAQVMAREPLDTQQQERLQVIRQSGDILMALLNDILDLSKIEAGRLELNPRVFELQTALDAVCAPFAYLASQKDLDFELLVEPSAAGRWRGDEMRLRQVVANLVSNAVKFTASGGVTVVAQARGSDLVVSVSDTGPGLYPAELTQLFSKFTQGRRAGAAHVGGTGLGLAISRELARLMDGEVMVSSTLGAGSTFEVCLPFARDLTPSPLAAETPSPGPDRPLRILAAEDNPTNQLILRSMLAPLDVDLELVADGEAAVAAFEAQVFDVVLMDIQMPRLNGIEATGAIRRLEEVQTRRRTPIVALSANVMAHQVEAYRAVGMDAVVEKPIDLTRLYATLEALTLADD